MTLIAQTHNFIIESHDNPEVGREDGGHLVISPKVKVKDRTDLSADLAKEMVLLTIIFGKALTNAMKDLGFDLGRINYQDNGNWKPELHIHLYGRALNAKYHPFGHPIKAAWTLEEKVVQEPLNEQDINLIKKHAEEARIKPGFEIITFI